MPVVDMPIEQLKKYSGINPKPKDFDSYWDRAIKEMKEVDPCVQLKHSEFQTPQGECFDLYFTGVKGARIHAKYLRPRGVTKPHPAVLNFHGYAGNSGDWSQKLSYVSLGFSIAALDCRGQGGSSEDVGGVKGTTLAGHVVKGLDGHEDNMLYRNIFLDTALLAKIVMDMEEVDEKRVGAFGLSQGGALTLACASLEPRIKKAAARYPFLSDYKRVWEMDLAENAYMGLRDYFRRFDPEHKREEEMFTKLGYIDIQNLVPRIKAKVMMGTGLMDTICPASTQFATYNKITSDKEVVIYPDYGHENIPGYEDKVINFMMDL